MIEKSSGREKKTHPYGIKRPIQDYAEMLLEMKGFLSLKGLVYLKKNYMIPQEGLI